MRRSLREGEKPFYFAPTSAAVETLREEGFDATTVQALFAKDARTEKQAVGFRVLEHLKQRKAVLVVDEAGLLGTEQGAKLFALAEKRNARVILVGDPRQHNSVERGDFPPGSFRRASSCTT